MMIIIRKLHSEGHPQPDIQAPLAIDTDLETHLAAQADRTVYPAGFTSNKENHESIHS